MRRKFIKGTVSIILSDPPCKDGNTRFTTVPWKALPSHVGLDIHVFLINYLFSFVGFLQILQNNGEIIRIKHFSSKNNDVLHFMSRLRL